MLIDAATEAAPSSTPASIRIRFQAFGSPRVRVEIAEPACATTALCPAIP
jgi:hypothetical protein